MCLAPPDDPLLPNWDQDQDGDRAGVQPQDPATVATELVAASAALADAFDRVEGEQWQLNGRHSNGASFTVDSLSRHLIHGPPPLGCPRWLSQQSACH
jgi:hypothetical protein